MLLLNLQNDKWFLEQSLNIFKDVIQTPEL